MQRRSLGLAVLLALAALASACGRSSDASDPPRNVILISLDTVRADHLGCYGRGRNTSPAIDSLAAAGVRFADASAASPWTLPSHVTMLTGLYPSRHGVKDYVHELPAERETLAEILGAHGFQSFAVLNTWSLADPRFALMQGMPPEHVRYIPEVEKSPDRGRQSVNGGREVVRAAREMLLTRDASGPSSSSSTSSMRIPISRRAASTGGASSRPMTDRSTARPQSSWRCASRETASPLPT